ncbi:DUF397 domain-containing protein [Streptomyces sp. NPDC001339]|uniref:DUF397 domain-containing protein n=1 Tax=Streptomyces sp. NPDC001339 TaxID=3364563 RepID=UPI0036784817
MTDRSPSRTGIPATAWFKSSHSGGEGNECVEVADFHGRIAVRDSKHRRGPALTFPVAAFASFIDTVRAISADG